MKKTQPQSRSVSLTSVLASDSALRGRLAALLPEEVRAGASTLSLVAPPRTTHYSLVGTAFDYLFRFEVERRNRLAITRSWVAARGVELAEADLRDTNATTLRWPKGADPNQLVAAMRGAYDSALRAYRCYIELKVPPPEVAQDVARHALRLAKLDPVYRAGYIDPNPASVDPLDVEDMIALLDAIPFEGDMGICLQPQVWLNPTFGSYSVGIHGADADLVAGGELVDIKTTKNPEVTKHLPQLIGYAILADAYRADEAPEFPSVDSVALYFSRQGRLIRLPLASARANADYPAVRSALLEHCRNAPLNLSDVLVKPRGVEASSPRSGGAARRPLVANSDKAKRRTEMNSRPVVYKIRIVYTLKDRARRNFWIDLMTELNLSRSEIANLAWGFFASRITSECNRVSLDVVNEPGRYVRPPHPKSGEPHFVLKAAGASDHPKLGAGFQTPD